MRFAWLRYQLRYWKIIFIFPIISSAVDATEPSSFEAPPSHQIQASSVTEVRNPGRKRGRKSTKNFSSDYTGNEPISLATENDAEMDEKICSHDLDKNLFDAVKTKLGQVHDLSQNQINDKVNQNESSAKREQLSLMVNYINMWLLSCVQIRINVKILTLLSFRALKGLLHIWLIPLSA